MSNIIITTASIRDCTIGTLDVDNGRFRCFTLELPWLNNIPFKSCIPSGVYQYVKHVSPSLGDVIYLKGVKDRTWIYIHKGNYTSQIHGCILVGTSIKDINNDGTPDVANSAKAFKQLMDAVSDEGKITITDSTRKL